MKHETQVDWYSLELLWCWTEKQRNKQLNLRTGKPNPSLRKKSRVQA